MRIKFLMLIVVLYSSNAFCQITNIKLKFKIFDGRVSYDGRILSKTYVLAYEKRPKKPYTGEYIVYYDEGIKSKQNYVNGKLNGLQSDWYKNGVKRRESYCEKGHSDGRFKAWYENGQKWEESYFSNDTLFFKQWHKTGEKMTFNYSVNGVKYGPSMGWHANGQKSSETFYKNGLRIGTSSEWYANGNKRIETEWVNENRVVDREWYEDGQISEETYYDKGNIKTEAQWYENGQKRSYTKWTGDDDYLRISYYLTGKKRSEKYIVNNEENGVEIEWYENGQKDTEVNWLNGVLHGPFYQWHEDGRLAYEGLHENGYAYMKNSSGKFVIIENTASNEWFSKLKSSRSYKFIKTKDTKDLFKKQNKD